MDILMAPDESGIVEQRFVMEYSVPQLSDLVESLMDAVSLAPVTGNAWKCPLERRGSASSP
jgi:hypothetical protein